MNPRQVLLLVLVSAACVVAGDALTAAWARSGDRFTAAAAMGMLVLGCVGYFPAIRYGGLAWVVALGSVLAAVGGVAVGVLGFGEHLDARRWCGVALAVASVALLADL